MTNEFSVTTLLKKLPDESAANKLYQRFVEQVVTLARQKLGGIPRRDSDEEDITQEVFEGFFRGVRDRKFLDLNDRHDLWQILFMLTERKAADAKRKFFSQKRGAGRVSGESGVDNLQDSQGVKMGLAAFPGQDPTPDFAAAAVEELQNLMDLLPDKELRQICMWKMEGFTNDEIANKIGRVTRSVENKLRLIRKYWTEEQEAVSLA
jgi:DNA-directed RNA polymerase specialized sigma24 family protein